MTQSMSDPNGAWAMDEAGKAQTIVDRLLIDIAHNSQREPPCTPQAAGGSLCYPLSLQRGAF